MFDVPVFAGVVCAVTAVLRSRFRRTAVETPQRPAAKSAAAKKVRLRILSVNDVYSALPTPSGGGFAELASAVQAARLAAPAGATTLFVCCGDFLGGSALAVHSHGRHAVDALTGCGVDAVVIGNHEFDHGDDTLKQLIADSPWPWLGANVVDAASGDVFDGAVATHTIALPAVDGSAGTQLGLFGVCTEYTPQLSYPSDRTRFLPAVDTAVQCVDTLSDGGCGLVVGLTHVSIAQDVAIAKACDGRLTAVLGGHDHTPFAQLEAASTLVLKSGQNATWLAVVDVDVDCDPVSGAPLRLPTLAWSMVPVVGYAPDPAVAATLRTHLADLDKATSVDGVPSSTPLCTLKGVLDTRSATVRHRHAFVGTLIANAMRDHLAADVALINGGFIRGDRLLDSGTVVTAKDLAVELPFPKEALVIRMTAHNLKLALGQMLQLCPAATGAFPHLSSNARCEYKAAGPPPHRVTSLRINGAELADAAVVNVGVTSFMHGGGDNAFAWRTGMDVTPPDKRQRVHRIVLDWLLKLRGGPDQPLPCLDTQAEATTRAVQ